jgi:hypothetical protein
MHFLELPDSGGSVKKARQGKVIEARARFTWTLTLG